MLWMSRVVPLAQHVHVRLQRIRQGHRGDSVRAQPGPRLLGRGVVDHHVEVGDQDQGPGEGLARRRLHRGLDRGRFQEGRQLGASAG